MSMLLVDLCGCLQELRRHCTACNTCALMILMQQVFDAASEMLTISDKFIFGRFNPGGDS